MVGEKALAVEQAPEPAQLDAPEGTDAEQAIAYLRRIEEEIPAIKDARAEREHVERAVALISEALGERRLQQKIDQSEFAKRIGTSQPAISRMEHGKVGVSMSFVFRYGLALGLKPSALLGVLAEDLEAAGL